MASLKKNNYRNYKHRRCSWISDTQEHREAEDEFFKEWQDWGLFRHVHAMYLGGRSGALVSVKDRWQQMEATHSHNFFPFLLFWGGGICGRRRCGKLLCREDPMCARM